MEAKIVERPAFTAVGLRYRGTEVPAEAPKLWGKLMGRVGEIKDMSDSDVAYGLQDNFDEETGAFDYVAAYEVSGGAAVPQGMIRWEIPANSYAVFSCTLPTVGPTFQKIYAEWLPGSGYQRAAGPEFELYDADFRADDPESPMYIYIPVREK
jgi:AraC family transcriptional regulator